ncbi:MAG TPA: nucleotide exchange factor GrpE [Sphingomicrobium sp.]|nr:nucleotide exchange factor GrpE [Sphingomicrobium sp.]
MTDGMTDEGKLHDSDRADRKDAASEAEEIRRETAEAAPELAEHDRLGELEKALEEANSKALYAAAETQNVRRRLEAEKVQAAAYASSAFARDMLAIKDHLERALVAVSDELREDKVARNFLDGIEATARELEAAFARQGITRIKSVGEKLDPHRHQAMMEIPTDNAEPGTIVEEMQAGYMLKDRLLRPALVGVAKAP